MRISNRSPTMAGDAIAISSRELTPRDLVLLTRLYHVGVALLAQREDLAVVGPRRRREAGPHPDPSPWVDRLAGQRVVGLEEPAVEQAVVDVAVDQRRRVVVTRPRQVPRDVVVG